MRLVESSTGQVEYSTRNSALIQTSHVTCTELNLLIMLNYCITHIINHIVLLNFVPFGGVSPLDHKIHIFAPLCNILCMYDMSDYSYRICKDVFVI